jgi:predicted dithiol-disulfide oxidoreductase (DUF899 family)
MTMQPIVSEEQWRAAREELLAKEKELTRARDAMAADRRRMPRMAVEREYAFEGPDGPLNLAGLFDGRSQLIVYRFFFEPGVNGWPEKGCAGCSMVAEIPWYTLTDDFDSDFDVGEWHGTNVFFREGDEITRTYFIDKRGDEVMGGTWAYLDITPLGRQETWEDSPEGYPQTPPYGWWNLHDEYAGNGSA